MLAFVEGLEGRRRGDVDVEVEGVEGDGGVERVDEQAFGACGAEGTAGWGEGDAWDAYFWCGLTLGGVAALCAGEGFVQAIFEVGGLALFVKESLGSGFGEELRVEVLLCAVELEVY